MSKILFLGPASPLVDWLREQGEWVGQYSSQLGLGDYWPGLPRSGPPIGNGCDWLISYGYRYIVPQEVLDMFPGRAINLHISYLPWNRGADPNLWSWAEDTPKGVTIHRMDAGIDTGPILFQTRMCRPWSERIIRENGTLRSTYEDLHATIQAAFRIMWWSICDGSTPHPQPYGGSYHTKADRAKVQHLLEPLGWDTPVSVLDSWAADNQMSEACMERRRHD